MQASMTPQSPLLTASLSIIFSKGYQRCHQSSSRIFLNISTSCYCRCQRLVTKFHHTNNLNWISCIDNTSFNSTSRNCTLTSDREYIFDSIRKGLSTFLQAQESERQQQPLSQGSFVLHQHLLQELS